MFAYSFYTLISFQSGRQRPPPLSALAFCSFFAFAMLPVPQAEKKEIVGVNFHFIAFLIFRQDGGQRGIGELSSP